MRGEIMKKAMQAKSEMPKGKNRTHVVHKSVPYANLAKVYSCCKKTQRQNSIGMV